MPSAAVRRSLAITTACSVLLGTSGCAGVLRGAFSNDKLAANGLTIEDDAFRRSLTAGGYADAYERAGNRKRGAPDDILLRALYRGTTAFHAGEFRAAAAAFAEADRLTERRETRSISRLAASLATNDQVLPYLPSRTERLFTRYYAMISWLRAEDLPSAVVEARRLGMLLQETSDSVGRSERAVHAMMREAAGAVFESAGEENDALVSYRNAARLRGESPGAIDSIRLEPRVGDSATVIVFVESGFVAHRVSQRWSLGRARPHQPAHVAAAPAHVRTVAHTAGTPIVQPPVGVAVADTTPRPTQATSGSSDAEVAQLVSEIADALDASDEGVFAPSPWHYRHLLLTGEGADGRIAPAISLAWPALLRTPLPRGPVSLDATLRTSAFATADSPATVLSTKARDADADVSDAIAADFRRALPSMLARLLVRSAAKAKAADMARDEYGWWAGALTGVAGDLLERADTRSWHLLPGQLRVVRLRVPTGDLAARVRIGEDSDALSVRLPARAVRAGEVLVLTARIFRDQSSLIP